MVKRSVVLFLVVAMMVPSLMVFSLQPSMLSSPLPTPTGSTAPESQPKAQGTTQIFIPSIGTGAYQETPAVRSPLIPRAMRRWMGRYGSLILLVLAVAALVLLRRSKRAS